MKYSKINVGEEYQAELGDCDETKQGVDQDDDFSELVFKPLDNLSRDDEDIREFSTILYIISLYVVCLFSVDVLMDSKVTYMFSVMYH